MKKLIIILLVLYSCNELKTSFYFNGVEEFNKKDYKTALFFFNSVDSTDQYFDDSQKYIIAIDSLIKAEEIIDSKNLSERIIEHSKNNKELNNLEEVLIELEIIHSYNNRLKEYSNSENTEVLENYKNIKTNLSKLQLKMLPILRKNYTNFLNKKLWENDIKAFNTKNNTVINFTGGLFAANKNIKDFQTQLNETLLKLRFKQANYRWYDESSEYTYYTIFEDSDSFISQ